MEFILKVLQLTQFSKPFESKFFLNSWLYDWFQLSRLSLHGKWHIYLILLLQLSWIVARYIRKQPIACPYRLPKLRLFNEIRGMQIEIRDKHGTQYKACRKTMIILALWSKLVQSIASLWLFERFQMLWCTHEIQWIPADDCLLLALIFRSFPMFIWNRQ